MLCKHGHERESLKRICYECHQQSVARWKEKKRLGLPCHRLDADTRFENSTMYAGDCIVWIAHSCDGRYGRFSYNKRSMPAHRFAYERKFGPLPDGLVIDHLCRNTFCVNPAHLEAVTPLENARRFARDDERSGLFNRSKTHCPQGHPYTGGNLYKWKNYRYCRKCLSKYTMNWQKQKRLEGLALRGKA